MSRLQVGGLALIIHDELEENIGKVVTIDVIYNETRTGSCTGAKVHDGCRVSCNDGFVLIDGSIVKSACTELSRLIPLGDKQTQDEFKKELENV
jgi:hypothetical protein